MRYNLGSLLFLLIFFVTLLNAEDFNFTPHANLTSPYVKEPVVLSIDLNQTNHNIVLFFNFDLKPSSEYIFKRIDSKETDNYHNTKAHYLYLVYPMKSGKIELHFNLIKRVTNDESIAYSFSGDRDNTKTLETCNTQISLPPLTLYVKPLPPKTLLVGDFTLSYDLGKTHAKAYEPIPFQVILKGNGYPPLLKSLISSSQVFTLFNEKPTIHSSYSKEGTYSKITYFMALSSEQSFTLPAINIKAFNPKKEQSYLLKIPSTHFDIEKVNTKTLIDNIDNPPPYTTDWNQLINLLGYLVVFGAGFTTGWLFRWKHRKKVAKSHPLVSKIDMCKERKILLQLLIAHNPIMFQEIIQQLESDLYNKESYSLKLLKQKAKEKLL
ncbi:MAG: hypothetical protein LGB66_03980 [Sulfurovum sp.]|nr:hypothetical protein [Sulfurovum sp.]